VGKKMRVLVTGGAGFIGSHLCERLLADAHEVLCLDNFFTGRRENIAHLLGESRFELVRHDVIEPVLLEVDQIYNLACPASPVHYQYNPVKTVKTNVMGMINMLGLAKRVRARVLQASTSEVYGDPQVHPQTEDYWGHVNPIGIRSCYDEGKRIAETLMMDYHRQNKVDIRIARIFNTYGPRMLENDGRVVSNLVVQALQGEELTLYGTGDQTRAFCYVDDLVEALVRLMNVEPSEGGEDVHQPVNLGNPGEFTIKQLAELIAELCGSEVKIKYCPLPQDDPRQRRPDISRAERLLGWSPRVQLREGLQKTIAYFRVRAESAAEREFGNKDHALEQ
jgi:UDP-glucuronate decarboxylase